ncbi:expressed unknown protein [Seminavis robusta]|uniref:Uncharacterized protein n=1 Tax=Seminavis robusta TaxID=568900 RepID=A0A9N8E5F7_9STRA|nr:expressed unknown protein [Seminavis robusta]|eukprot:Sro671_g184800.1 n/a (460) ;mRNA; r:5358-6737
MSNQHHPSWRNDGVSSNRPFHLRGTHLYLMLDDIARTGPEDILKYIDSLITTPPTVVESVFVKGAMSRNAGRIPDAVSLSVFQALSGLTRVQRWEVSGDGRFGGLYLPVQAMTVALQHCPPNLLHLRLGNVILTSASPTAALRCADMQSLAQSLRKLPRLTSIDLVRCRTEETIQQNHPEPAKMTLQPLVQAISSMSTLQQAMFCETVISGNTGLYLGELCKSPSLQKLWWKTMPGMTDDHIVSMAACLMNSTRTSSLRELTIRSHGLGARAGYAIAELLRFNTTLQVINLDLGQAAYGIPIAAALHHCNTTLQCLDVWAWGGELHSDSSRAITKVFTDMLEVNTSLKFLTFQGLDWTNPHIDYYLRLNRAERQRLVRDFADRKVWVDTLIRQKEDVDVIFHFLSLNPSILMRNGGTTSSRVPTKGSLPTQVSVSKRKDGPALLEQFTWNNKHAKRIIS